MPGGYSFSVHGKTALYVVVAAGLAGMLIWVNHADHQTLLSELQIQTYMLSLPNENRPRVAPPPAFAKRGIAPERGTP